MGPEVAQVVPLQQRHRHIRRQGLTAMTGGGEMRRGVHSRPEVARLVLLGLAGVRRHLETDVDPAGPGLLLHRDLQLGRPRRGVARAWASG